MSNILHSSVVIDNITQHPTPEGVMLTLMPAGLMPRASAWLLDLTIRALVVSVLFFPMMLLGRAGYGLFLILLFVINWLYPVFFEVWRGGMTPGKKRSGIYVCHDDGTPITLQSSMIRNLLRVVDFLPFMYASGILSIMFNRKSQRLGDMVAGTVVVYQEQENIDKIYQSIYGLVNRSLNDVTHDPYEAHLQHGSTVKKDYEANSALFTYPLNTKEQQALLSLSDRLVFLPVARQYEITSHLSPMINSYNQFGRHNANNEAMVYQAVVDKGIAIKGGTTVRQSRLSNSKASKKTNKQHKNHYNHSTNHANNHPQMDGKNINNTGGDQ